MRSPDNLAKYAAGGRDPMAVAAGRDHFSPTNQPVAMCAKTFHKMFKPQPPSSQPSLNKSPSVAHLPLRSKKAKMLALCNTFETGEKVLAFIQNSDRVIK